MCRRNSFAGKPADFLRWNRALFGSFLSSTDFGTYENLPEYRAELEKRADMEGIQSLRSELQNIDKETADSLNAADIKRIIRALEVYRSTGIPLSEWKRRSKLSPAKYDSLLIGLKFENRELLYNRINQRVDLMIEQGLVEETRGLMERGLMNTPTAGQAIGYKELYPYFSKEATLPECIEKLKQNTRRYAKRQMTWFRRNSAVSWITLDGKTAEEIKEEAELLVKKSRNVK